MSGSVYSAAGRGRSRGDERPLQNISASAGVSAGRVRQELGRNMPLPNPCTETRSSSLSNRVNHLNSREEPRTQGSYVQAGVANNRRANEPIYQQAGVANNRRANEPIYQQAGVANNRRANEPIYQQADVANSRRPIVVGRAEKQVISVVALAILGLMILPSLIKLVITVGTIIFIARYFIGNRNDIAN